MVVVVVVVVVVVQHELLQLAGVAPCGTSEEKKPQKNSFLAFTNNICDVNDKALNIQ